VKKIIFLFATLAGIILVAGFGNQIVFAGSSDNLSGYAWSDTIGWVSFNCTDAGSCSTTDYGVRVDPPSGAFSGYAWSENIGWISFNAADTAGCPSAPCAPALVTTTTSGTVTGWAKALSASGGWDGWIRLSGTAADSSSYGGTIASTTFSGYSWGSDVVGWLSWSGSGYGVRSSVDLVDPPSCTPAYFCSGNDLYYRNASCVESLSQSCSYGCSGSACIPPPSIGFTSFSATNISYGPFTATGHLEVKPSLLWSGDTTSVYWNVSNSTSCTVTGTNGDSWSGGFSGSAGRTSSPITSQTSYTLSCAGFSGAAPSSITETVNVNIIPVFEEL